MKIDKNWHRGVIIYLKKKGLSPKDIRANMVATLAYEKKSVAESRRRMESLEI